MKTSNLFGVTKASLLLLALVFAFAITSCGGDDGGGGAPTVFDGTWENSSGSERLILSGSNFTFLGDEFGAKGTFSFQELQANTGTITLNFSQFSIDGVKWYNRTQFIDAMIIEFSGIPEASWNSMPNEAKQAIRDEFAGEFELPTKETGIYTLSNDNNTLTLASDSVSDTYYRVGGGPGPNPPNTSNPFVGTWTGIDGDDLTLTCTDSAWTITYEGETYGSGTYTRSGNTATLKEGNSNVGTATVTGNTMTVFINGVTLIFTKGGGNPPGGTWTPPTNYTQLSAGVWSSGNIPSSGTKEQWFRFTATAATQYIHASFDTLADIYAQVYNSSGITVGEKENLWGTGSNRYASFSLTTGQIYYIKVTPYYSSDYGSYQIAFNTSSTAPGSGGAPTWTPPTTYTTLTNGQWTESSITSSIRERWFAFSVNSGNPYYMWWNDSDGDSGTVDVRATAYYSNGNTIFLNADVAWSTARSFNASSTGTVYIKVDTSSSSTTGDFAIAYRTTNTRPGTEITLPTTYTTLTEGQWTGGLIPSSGTREEWFRFTATASTQYIHVKVGTLTDLYVQVYNSIGGPEGGSTELYSYSTYISRTLTSGQIYYIKVTPYSSSYSGTYDITFNTSSTAPLAEWPPSTFTTMSNENRWYSGNIPSSGTREQWFRFTATASTQYIHVTHGTLTDLYVQVYNSSGGTVGSNSNLYGSSPYISRTLTSGQIYYIKVTPYSSIYSGTYDIAFNTSSATPPAEWPPITSTTMSNANQWYSGNIPSSGTKEQWFIFTATATTQYIHVKFGGLTDLWVQVYNSNGVTVGDRENFYSSSRYISRPLTSGQTYYINVWPYSSSGSGTYDIAFNTSITAPAN